MKSRMVVFVLVFLLSEMGRGEPKKVQMFPLIDANGKESGCVYQHDGKCYATIEVLQTKLLKDFAEFKRAEITLPKTSEIIRYKEGKRMPETVITFEGLTFGSNIDVVDYLVTQLNQKQAKVAEPVLIGGKPHDTVLFKLHEAKNGKTANFVVLKLDWDELEKQTPIAQKRVDRLAAEDVQLKDHPERVTKVDPTKELFIYGGLLRGAWPEHQLTGHTPRIHLFGDLSDRPEFILVAIGSNGRSSSESGVSVYSIISDGRPNDINNKKQPSMIGCDHHYSMTAGQLQEVLGKTATIVSLGTSQEEALQYFKKK